MHSLSRVDFRVVAIVALLGGCLATVRSARADGTVGTGNATTCTEEALDLALAGGGTVTFDCGAFPVSIPITSTKEIGTDTTLDAGSAHITLRGTGFVRLFAVSATTLSLRNLTLTGGGAIEGGAVDVLAGATLWVSGCTFTENAAFSGGALANSGMAEVSNSTFFGNIAGAGAAMVNRAGATLTVLNTTIAANIDLGGPEGVFFGSLFNDDGAVTLKNSIVANTSSGVNCVGPITDVVGNLQYPDDSCFARRAG
jgi:hypothetical protein